MPTFASAQPAIATCPTGSGVAYQRREPERTLLHRIVRENLAAFLAEAAERYPSGELPHFIVCEFERYLRCGLICHGFARVRCPTCRDELLVAFSCKNPRRVSVLFRSAYGGHRRPPTGPGPARRSSAAICDDDAQTTPLCIGLAALSAALSRRRGRVAWQGPCQKARFFYLCVAGFSRPLRVASPGKPG